MLERRGYSERPPRHEYLLTEKGRELVDVLLAMVAWGDRWTAGDKGPTLPGRLGRYVAPGEDRSGDAGRDGDVDGDREERPGGAHTGRAAGDEGLEE